jgi:hypothetical protein
LSRLRYPRDRFEVIVVDDGSPTPPSAVVESYRAQMGVRLHSQRNRGPATARNTGAARPMGELLPFTDDDCAPAADWLDCLAETLAANPDCVVGGRVVNGLPRNLCSTASQLLVSHLYDYFQRRPDERSVVHEQQLRVAHGAVPRSGRVRHDLPAGRRRGPQVLRPLGGAGPAAGLRPAGSQRPLSPADAAEFWRQHLHYGRGAYRLHLARARRRAAPVKVEPLSFYFRLLGYPFAAGAAVPPCRATVAVRADFLTQVVNPAGFFLEKQSLAAPQAPVGDG